MASDALDCLPSSQDRMRALQITALAILLAFPIACGRGDYWVHTRAPGPVNGPYFAADLRPMCMADALGCYVIATGTIWLKSGMSDAMLRCVTRHEYRHASGDDHPGFPENPLAIDCGDGTVFVPS